MISTSAFRVDNFTPSAHAARGIICDLADHYSWETVAKEMISRMSGDEAREFVEDFKSLYND